MATKIITFLRNWNRFLIHGVPRTSADFQSNIVLVHTLTTRPEALYIK